MESPRRHILSFPWNPKTLVSRVRQFWDGLPATWKLWESRPGRLSLQVIKHRLYTHTRVGECNGLWPLKNSISQNWSKKLCARKPYKRLFELSGHFLSPQFWLFGRKLEFFNIHVWLHQLRGDVMPQGFEVGCGKIDTRDHFAERSVNSDRTTSNTSRSIRLFPAAIPRYGIGSLSPPAPSVCRKYR